MPHLYELTAHELHKKLKAKEVSAVELAESVFERVEAVEGKVHAYVRLTKDVALEQARRVDGRIKAGEEIGPLAGIPIAVKDLIATEGVTTTCSSKILANYVPIYNATVMDKLAPGGTVMVGKANMDEFAMGSSTENSAFGPTRNPWDLERVPGGSSGGSAAAVAADEAVLALGSDTGGSIRQPAALCGIVGLKPTYGLVSRYGLVAFASSLDQIGPLTKDVRDCATLLGHISGHDPRDSTSAPYEAPDYAADLGGDISGVKAAVVKEMMGADVDPSVRQAVEAAVAALKDAGVEVDEVSLPHLDYALSAYYIIAPAEASSNLARYDGVRYGHRTAEAEDIFEMYARTRAEGFGDEVKRRIMLGTYALSAGYYEAYYGQAQKVRTLIIDDFTKAFEEYSVLISPTTPTPAFKIGEKTDDPLQMYLSDVMTIPVNLAGIPAISLPAGLAEDLPAGVQLIAKAFGEEILLKVAHKLEQALAFKEKPKL